MPREYDLVKRRKRESGSSTGSDSWKQRSLSLPGKENKRSLSGREILGGGTSPCWIESHGVCGGGFLVGGGA